MFCKKSGQLGVLSVSMVFTENPFGFSLTLFHMEVAVWVTLGSWLWTPPFGGVHKWGIPHNGWFIMENHDKSPSKMDDLGVPPWPQETSNSKTPPDFPLGRRHHDFPSHPQCLQGFQGAIEVVERYHLRIRNTGAGVMVKTVRPNPDVAPHLQSSWSWWWWSSSPPSHHHIITSWSSSH